MGAVREQLTTLYETDFAAWAFEQAEAIKRGDLSSLDRVNQGQEQGMAKREATAGGGSGKDKAKAEPAAPWERENPKADGEHKRLSPQAKAAAKRSAKKAGRPYPNLVDNMRAAGRSKK